MPLSLDTLLIQPSNSGSFSGASGTASLPTGTTAGSTVLICVATNSSTMSATGFTDDSGTQVANVRTYLLRKSNVAAGETSWSLTVQAGSISRWTVYELGGLDPDAPVDVKRTTTTSTTSGTTASSGTLGRSTTYDGLIVALHGSYHSTSTAVTTFSGHTNGMTEMDEGAVDDGVSKAVNLSVSMRATQQLSTFETTATTSTTLAAPPSAGATIVCYTAAGAKREVNVAHFWAFFPGVSSTPAGLNTGNAGAKYFEAVTGTPAITTDGLQLTGAASAQTVQSAAISTTAQTVKAFVVRIRLRLDSLSGDLELARQVANVDVVLRYVTASGKLGLKIGTGTEQVSTATVTTGTWYNLDLRVVGTTTAWTCDWQLDYGAGPVTQAQASATAGTALASVSALLGWSAASTGTVSYAYAVYSVVYGHYPLGDWAPTLLKVDPSGTLTISGTTANFNTFTANGTMAAWNATTARGAIDEAPPTVGASADGLAQVSTAAADYVEIPMETSAAAVGNGSIRAVRMLACGWAASGTAATIGFRGYEGSAETTLFATADPNFDNSTTTPAWVCAMYRPTNGWTQAKLDALAFRVGFSDDATPDIGIHAIYAEVAMQPGDSLRVAEVTGLEGVTAAATVDAVLDPVTGGPIAYTASAAPDFDAAVSYTIRGTPTTTNIPAGSNDLVIVDAADATEVTSVSIGPA